MLLFQTGDIEFAIDRNCISRIQPVPEASTDVKGRVQQQPIEVEGGELLLIDLAAASNNDKPASYPLKAEMIVVKESRLALFADQVKSTLDLNGERIDELPPVFGGTARACFPNVLQMNNQMILVIDPDALKDVGPYAAALGHRSKSIRHCTEDDHTASLTEKVPKSMQSPSNPVEKDTLEVVVEEKLRKIIGHRVKEVVAQTIARTLENQND
jgi:chemotaxis signal transduction protein